MPNPNPKQENLKKFKSKWNSGKTRAIRVPEVFADQLLEIARKLDNNQSITCTTDNSNANGLNTSNNSISITNTCDSTIDTQDKPILSKTEAIEQIDRLIAHKKSKKDTLLKLIKVIYKD